MTVWGWYVDPGVEKLALAIADDRSRLVWVGFFPTFAAAPSCIAGVTELVIEKPRIYPGLKETDPNDLIDLWGAAQWFAGSVHAVGGPKAVFEYPADWKGQAKKPIHHDRIWRALDDAEKAIFAAAAGMSVAAVGQKIEKACHRLAQTGKVTGYSWAAHNLFDSVGLFLYRRRRVGRAGARLT